MASNPVPLSPAQINFARTSQWLQLVRQSFIDSRVSIPAIAIEDIDVDTQTVTVQIAIREKSRTPTGPEWTELAPVILVPVIIPRAGNRSITLPVKKDNEGLLIFCDTCFDLWFVRSGVQNTLGDHRHEHWDCGFLPGLTSQPNKLANYSADSLQIRTDDGSQIIDIADDQVTVTATKLVVNTTGDIDLTAQGNVNITGAQVNIGNATKIDNKTFLSHVHTGVQSGGSDTGPVGP